MTDIALEYAYRLTELADQAKCERVIAELPPHRRLRFLFWADLCRIALGKDAGTPDLRRRSPDGQARAVRRTGDAHYVGCKTAIVSGEDRK
jgi:hypothetical protein